MKSKLSYISFFLLLLTFLVANTGCKATYSKVSMTKSRHHLRPYDDSRDRGRKRVKVIKQKALKQTKSVS